MFISDEEEKNLLLSNTLTTRACAYFTKLYSKENFLIIYKYLDGYID